MIYIERFLYFIYIRFILIMLYAIFLIIKEKLKNLNRFYKKNRDISYQWKIIIIITKNI